MPRDERTNINFSDLPAGKLEQHQIQRLQSRMDFQKNHHTLGVEHGLREAQYCRDKRHQIFFQSEASQEQHLVDGLQTNPLIYNYGRLYELDKEIKKFKISVYRPVPHIFYKNQLNIYVMVRTCLSIY